MFQNENSCQKSNPKAVAYLRISDDRQSTETQKVKAIKYALDNDLILTEDMIIEEEEPASTTKHSPMVSNLSTVFKHRPGLLKILTMASYKEFSNIIVYSCDRLARNVFENALIKHHLDKNNIQIHFTKEGERFKNDPLSLKLQNILACYAEFEASAISTRVFDSLSQVFNRGDWPGGRSPFGFTFKNTETGTALDVDKSKLEIVQTIFQLYAAGHGYRKIADILSKKYFPYQFHKSTVEYIIGNEIYFGISHWGKKGGRRKGNVKNDNYLKLEYEEDLAIVNADTKNVVSLLRKHKANIKDPQYFSSPYILKDLLICSKCGKKLTVKNYGKNKASVYRCPTHENSKSHNIVKTKLIEDLVLEKLSNINHSKGDLITAYDKYIALFNEKLKMYEDINSNIKDKILSLEANVNNINEMLDYAPKEYVLEGLLKYKLHYEQEISLLSNQKIENEKIINKTLLSFDEFSNQIFKIIREIPDKRILCFLVIDKILVCNDNNKLNVDIIVSPKSL